MIDWLLAYLFQEYPEQLVLPPSYAQKRALLRALVNVRPPAPISAEFLQRQDAFLQEEARQRGIVPLADIPTIRPGGKLSLWQGDITRLQVDAIVNAANSALLGCFVPGHACIDNAIHTFAGVQLREACSQLIEAQGHDEPTGTAHITPAYNLPSRFILHTVGPIVQGQLTQLHRDQLASCYRACLALAAENRLTSVAFCCISTGEYRFPKREAAQIAVDTVSKSLEHHPQMEQVVFNVFSDEDRSIYEDVLAARGVR